MPSLWVSKHGPPVFREQLVKDLEAFESIPHLKARKAWRGHEDLPQGLGPTHLERGECQNDI